MIGLRNEDIRRGGKLVADYDYMRKRNICVLISIGLLLFLALFYIIFSNLNKHMGSENN